MAARALLASSLSLLLAACVADVGEGRVAAQAADPAPATEAVVADRTVQVDTARSRVHALGAKVTQTHDIVFDDWQGQLKLSGDAVVGMEVTVQMRSLRADADKLTAHLQSADFFDVETYPTATFSSASVVQQPGPDGATHRVTGALSMHGVTRQLAFPMQITDASGTLRAQTEFVIDRKDFDITYPGMPDDLIQDNVVLTVALVGEKIGA